jgi:hypothetical protein
LIMAKEISIRLKIENAMKVGLAKAKSNLSEFGSGVSKIGGVMASFGRGLLDVGKWAVQGFTAATAAVAGFAAKAVHAYAQQQKAEQEFAGALKAHGEAVDVNLERIKRYASQIQNETAVADENLIARAARLRMLGVETDALDQAMRATVALASAGMGEEQAIRAVAMAHQGNYEALQRYIPALRNAASESEKAQITNDFLTRGYAQQAQMLDTVGGRWREFRGRISDLWEEFGRAIDQNGTVARGLEHLSSRVVEFGQRVREYVDGAHFQAVQNSIEGIVRALAGTRAERNEVLIQIGELMKAALARGGELAGQAIMKIAPEVGKIIGSAIKMAMSRPMSPEIKDAADQLGIDRGFMSGAFGFMHGFTEEQKLAIHQQIQLNRQTEEFARLGVTVKSSLDGMTAAEFRLQEAIQNILNLGKEKMQTLSEPIDTSGTEANFARVQESAKAMMDQAQEAFEAQREAIKNLEEVAEEALEVFNRPMDTTETEAAVLRIGEAAQQAAEQAAAAFGEGSIQAEEFGRIASQAMEILSGPLDTSAAQEGIKAIGEAAKEMASDARAATWEALSAAQGAAREMSRAVQSAADAGAGAMRQIAIAGRQSADEVQKAAREKEATERQVSQQIVQTNQQSGTQVTETWRQAGSQFEQIERNKVSAAAQAADEIANHNVQAARSTAAAWSSAASTMGGAAGSSFQLGRWSGGGSFVSASSQPAARTTGFNLQQATGQMMSNQDLSTGLNNQILRTLNNMDQNIGRMLAQQERLLTLS